MIRKILKWLLHREAVRHLNTYHADKTCVFCYMKPTQISEFIEKGCCK